MRQIIRRLRGSAAAPAEDACPAPVTALAVADNRRTHVITAIVIIAVAYLFFHVGHSHANYRHGRGGVNLYWTSIRGPWISVPGPFGTRIGHRL
jgi:hypothetical protein